MDARDEVMRCPRCVGRGSIVRADPQDQDCSLCDGKGEVAVVDALNWRLLHILPGNSPIMITPQQAEEIRVKHFGPDPA